MTKPVDLIMIGDFGKDNDDESALVLSAGLQKLGLVRLLAIVANLEPALLRAQLAKGTLNQLGLSEIKVAEGTPCFKGGTNLKHETDVPYLASSSELWLSGGQELLFKIMEEEDGPITLVLNSGLTDAAMTMMNSPKLFLEKISNVCIMGGVLADGDKVLLDDVGFMVPQIGKFGAANNNFDESSALFVYRFCQEHKVPLTIVAREAAYACQVPFTLYDQLAATGNPISEQLSRRQRPSFEGLWQAANTPPDSPQRGKLPPSRNRKWFIDTFCGGKDPGISNDSDIWTFLERFQLYDPMNVVAAVPELQKKFYTPTEVVVKNTTHRVIGVSKTNHGIADETGLRQFIIETEVKALQDAGNQ